MKRHLSQRRLASILPLSALLAAFPVMVLAQGMPPGADAGFIDNHFRNQMMIERMEPWRFRPVTPQDINPLEGQEPVIEFLNTEVEGHIVVPDEKDPSIIHIK